MPVISRAKVFALVACLSSMLPTPARAAPGSVEVSVSGVVLETISGVVFGFNGSAYKEFVVVAHNGLVRSGESAPGLESVVSLMSCSKRCAKWTGPAAFTTDDEAHLGDVRATHPTHGKVVLAWKRTGGFRGTQPQSMTAGFCGVMSIPMLRSRQPAVWMSISSGADALGDGNGIADARLSGRIGRWRFLGSTCGELARNARLDLTAEASIAS